MQHDEFAHTQTRRIGDIDVCYRERTPAQVAGPPVVMIHGLAEDHRSWGGVQTGLDHHQTLAYDLRGHGTSSLGDANATLEQIGQDLIGFMDAVTGPGVAVGYSLGGAVVLWAALQRPDLFSQAIVIGTSSIVGRAAVGFFDQRIETLSTDFRAFCEDLRADTKAQIVTADVDLEAVTARRIEAIGDGGGYVNAARAMAGLHGKPLTAELAQLRCPLDVIYGDKDLFCPRKAAEIIVAAAPDATITELANAGHLMSVDQPQAYLNAIQSALDQHAIEDN